MNPLTSSQRVSSSSPQPALNQQPWPYLASSQIEHSQGEPCNPLKAISPLTSRQIALDQREELSIKPRGQTKKIEADHPKQACVSKSAKIFHSTLLPKERRGKLAAILESVEYNRRLLFYFTRTADQLAALDLDNHLGFLRCCQMLIAATFSYRIDEKKLLIEMQPFIGLSPAYRFATVCLTGMDFSISLDGKKIEIRFSSDVEVKDFIIFILIKLESEILCDLSSEKLDDYFAFVESQDHPHPFSHILKEFSNQKSFLYALQKNLLFSSCISQEEEEAIKEKWQNYVVKKTDWNKFYRSCNQQAYGRHMHHTIQIAVSGLKNEKWNFDALLSFLARRRQLIAYQLNHPRPHVVGCFRTKPDRPYITICVEDYKELAFRLKKLLARQEWANLRADAAVLSRRGMRGQGYCYEEKLRGERITLSYAFLYDKPLSLDSCFNGQPIYGEIIHTSADKINRILNFIKEDLYPKSLAAQTSDERLAYLGQIFWWICQAKPWDLGDPSIAETFIRSILALKEEESPPWKTGLVPWIEVMCEPEVEKFAANFSLLFEWPTCHSGLSERASAG